MRADTRRPLTALAIWLLTAFGIACLVYYLISAANTWWFQREAKIRIEEMITIARPPAEPEIETAPGAPARPGTRPKPRVVKPLKRGELIGRVDIPRLKLSAAVAEGDDGKILARAVGHLPDTPLPWHRRGNVAFAAHRDGLFRPLEGIRLNDELRVRTPRGDYHYRVKRTRIVDPDDVWVLAPTRTPTLTLITCYPFSYVGRAPRRFVVQAELVGHIAGTAVSGSVVQ